MLTFVLLPTADKTELIPTTTPLSEDSEWIDRVAEATAVKTEEHSSPENNGAFISMLRMAFTAALKEEGGGDVTVPVNVYVGDEQLTEHVNKVNRRDRQRGRI